MEFPPRFYPDLGFLLSLHFDGDHTAAASSVARKLDSPLSIDLVHQLLFENGCALWLKDRDPAQSARVARGLRLWREHLVEGVFQVIDPDFDTGFRLALEWNRQENVQSLPWSALVHLALAVTSGAKAFLSFDPQLRTKARQIGIPILPSQLGPQSNPGSEV
jgi:hypothetical protein